MTNRVARPIRVSSFGFPSACGFLHPGFHRRPGNLGRYAVRAPGQWTLDFSLAKNFAITERTRFQLRGDAFNSFNHTNLGGLVTDISKSNFGFLTSATPRTVQLGAKFLF